MNVTKEDRQLAHEFYYKTQTGNQIEWMEYGNAASTEAKESINEDVLGLAELIARVRVDGGLRTLREAYSKLETDLRKAEARAENLELACEQAVAMLKEMHHEALAVLIEQRVAAAAGAGVR